MPNDRAPQIIRYTKPDVTSGKKIAKLCRTDRMIGLIQVVADGGETNLHSHGSTDGFWFVLSGRVRFYGAENALIGEFGPNEGVLIPRKYPYWFESVGDTVAEILQVESFDKSIPDNEGLFADRTDYQPRARHGNTL